MTRKKSEKQKLVDVNLQGELKADAVCSANIRHTKQTGGCCLPLGPVARHSIVAVLIFDSEISFLAAFRQVIFNTIVINVC